MEPKIITITEKNFIGYKTEMSFVNNKTGDLWKIFLPRKKEVNNIIGNELFSIELYPPSFFINFNPNNNFEKWAAVEVSSFNNIPENMDKYVSPEGLYAVFTYKGLASNVPKMYQNILQTWIPNSGYSLDTRPHFAVMGDKYKNNDPNSEEELWIPIMK
jgi:AraC family transcriptional regulator